MIAKWKSLWIPQVFTLKHNKKCHKVWIDWLSTRLVQLLDPKKLRFTKSWVFYVFGSAQNATFWKKLHFGPRQKMRSKHANIMDRKRFINQNAYVRLNNTVGLDGQLRKYPDKNSLVLTPDGLNILPLLLLSFVFFNAHWSFFFFFFFFFKFYLCLI